MSTQIRDQETGQVVATAVNDVWVPAPDYPGSDVVMAWQTAGVPSLRGETHGDTIVEVEDHVSPDDPLFGLALIDAADRLGWDVVDVDDVVKSVRGDSGMPRIYLRAVPEGFFKSLGGPFIGPNGGKWADSKHTIPWHPDDPHGAKAIHAQHPSLSTAKAHAMYVAAGGTLTKLSTWQHHHIAAKKTAAAQAGMPGAAVLATPTPAAHVAPVHPATPTAALAPKVGSTVSGAQKMHVLPVGAVLENSQDDSLWVKKPNGKFFSVAGDASWADVYEDVEYAGEIDDAEFIVHSLPHAPPQPTATVAPPPASTADIDALYAKHGATKGGAALAHKEHLAAGGTVGKEMAAKGNWGQGQWYHAWQKAKSKAGNGPPSMVAPGTVLSTQPASAAPTAPPAAAPTIGSTTNHAGLNALPSGSTVKVGAYTYLKGDSAWYKLLPNGGEKLVSAASLANVGPTVTKVGATAPASQPVQTAPPVPAPAVSQATKYKMHTVMIEPFGGGVAVPELVPMHPKFGDIISANDANQLDEGAVVATLDGKKWVRFHNAWHRANIHHEPLSEISAINGDVTVVKPTFYLSTPANTAPSAPPTLTAAQIMDKQTGPKAGSNQGGRFKGDDGKERYVKHYIDPAQAHGEVLANSLYRELGHAAPKSVAFDRGQGKVSFASEIMPDHKGELGKQGGITQPLAREALKGFAADVLTANWDVAGLDHDNMVVQKDGSIARIDNGSAFLTRAQGERKKTELLHEHVTEPETFFNAQKNGSYAKLAKIAGHSKAADIPDLKQQVDKIVQLRNQAGGWEAFVTTRAPLLNGADKATVVKMLEARTAALQKLVV